MPLLRVTGGPTPPAGLTLANATLEVTFERPYADGTSVHPLVHHAELDTSTGSWKPIGSADGTPFYLPGAALGDPTPPPVVLTERQEYADETTQRFARRIQTVIETDLDEWAYATPASSLVVVDADELFPYGSSVVEQRTNAEAVGAVVTFDEPVTAIEIANLDAVDGVFTVNGFPITVFARAGYRSPIGGTPTATVAIDGSTAYEIRRLA